MKIIIYILFAVILIILYITEPLWEPQFNTNVKEVPQIAQEVPEQQGESNHSNIDGTETLQKIEEDFGKNLMLDMSQVSKNL